MRFLLAPGNNSLSHLAKCLAIREALLFRGHEVVLASSAERARFLQDLGVEYESVPDLQEGSGSGFPTIDWFSKPGKVAHCLREESALLRRVRPDRVLGVFRFTLKGAAQRAGVPYDSLICGSMLPRSGEVLGFRPDEPDWAQQETYLSVFFRYAGARLGRALQEFDLPEVADAREMLVGERTFLWDFPEFQPLPENHQAIHVGPIVWNRWPIEAEMPAVPRGNRPLAVVTFGTCCADGTVAARLASILCVLGYRVLVAAGGQAALSGLRQGDQVAVCHFAPMDRLLPQTALLISHGGQMTVFEALSHAVPGAVFPFQPEQAHNGLCLERMGCGRRLIPARPFLGNSSIYLDAFAAKTDREIADLLDDVVNHQGTANRLRQAQQTLSCYRGASALAPLLEAC